MKSWLGVRSAAVLGAGIFLQLANAHNAECPHPAEIVIHHPAEYVCCGKTTSTIFAQTTMECSGVPAYVTPGVPIPEGNCVTTTKSWDGPTTETITIPPSGWGPTTKIVKIPGWNPDCITTTMSWTGTTTKTVTIPPAQSKGPSTVVVKTPCDESRYVTKTAPWAGSTATTFTVPPHRGEPGAVVIKTPHSGYVTKTVPWGGSKTVTYTVPPKGTDCGEVIVKNPVKYITETIYWTGTKTETYTIPGFGTRPDLDPLEPKFTGHHRHTELSHLIALHQEDRLPPAPMIRLHRIALLHPVGSAHLTALRMEHRLIRLRLLMRLL
ncbi:uncharacterized protein TrAtP1_003319 [Trichoderma atroviride]|uniref:uncharacterized protein n=1 Tax=Hypocrea atroviridis TaxID=63577 RepID=UPI00331873A0|nr:hypothetical protein TrAtP1_003319 [Trichoderma atroviride]